MAAERPIVSTAITDVSEAYGDCVHVARDTAEFIAACERALRASPSELEARYEVMRKTLATTSWDQTAAAMCELIEQTLHQRRTPRTLLAGTCVRKSSGKK